MSTLLAVARLALSLILVLAAPEPVLAGSDACTQMAGQMSASINRYRATMGALRAFERELGPPAGRSAEAMLRSVRGYESLRRDAHLQRGTLLSLYETLAKQTCPPFDQNGLEATREEFQRLDHVEEQTLRRARALLDCVALR